MEIDATVYPDTEPPAEFRTIGDRADYVHRVCSAFDFGVPPTWETVRLFGEWREVFDRFPLPHSPAYHAFRAFFAWGAVPRAPYFGVPGYVKLDAADGREDGFEDRV